MPLRKSPTITSRLLDANRANAQHSTGPKTAKGKARSRLNGLRTGKRSKLSRRLNDVLAWCAPADIRATAAQILTPELLEHPFYAFQVRCWEEIWEMGVKASDEYRRLRWEERQRLQKSARAKRERSLESRGIKKRSHQVAENKRLRSKFEVNASTSVA